MSKDEALKMAIEALETSDAIVAEYSGVHFERIQPAIQACKEALQQPMQDFFERGKEIAKWADKQNEQPAQEPVAWMCTDNYDEVVFLSDKTCNECQPLYTHPAPLWQGLSDDEINDIKTKTIMGANGMSVEQLLGLIVSLTEQTLRNKKGY